MERGKGPWRFASGISPTAPRFLLVRLNGDVNVEPPHPCVARYVYSLAILSHIRAASEFSDPASRCELFNLECPMSEERNPSYKHRILCTEDDADTRELLRMLLELEGFEVSSAEDSAEAIRLAKAEKFDLYLLDHWMPEMTGDLLCQKLREFDSTIPVLFYSGAATETDKERAMASGAQGYIVKPADPEKLVAEIRRLLLNKN
jgi:CheY-like chemotaxis protein